MLQIATSLFPTENASRTIRKAAIPTILATITGSAVTSGLRRCIDPSKWEALMCPEGFPHIMYDFIPCPPSPLYYLRNPTFRFFVAPFATIIIADCRSR